MRQMKPQFITSKLKFPREKHRRDRRRLTNKTSDSRFLTPLTTLVVGSSRLRFPCGFWSSTNSTFLPPSPLFRVIREISKNRSAKEGRMIRTSHHLTTFLTIFRQIPPLTRITVFFRLCRTRTLTLAGPSESSSETETAIPLNDDDAISGDPPARWLRRSERERERDERA